MKQLIVTADDYGMSKGVNEAIDAGVSCGLITSTNVMTNMEYYREAEKLREMPVSVGVHWTICTGKPVLPPSEIPSLVDNNGNFFSYGELRSRYRKRLVSDDDIVKELKAQYNRFVEVCGEPDYWNTHQNTHVDFRIFQLFVDTAKELGIHKMRSHQRVYVPGSDNSRKMSLKWRLLEPIKSKILDNWLRKAHQKGISSPEGVVVCLNKNDLNDLSYVFSHIKWQNKQVAEYVIHPATINDSPFFGKIVEQRIREWKQFTAKETPEQLQKNDITLVDFSKI